MSEESIHETHEDVMDQAVYINERAPDAGEEAADGGNAGDNERNTTSIHKYNRQKQ